MSHCIVGLQPHSLLQSINRLRQLAQLVVGKTKIAVSCRIVCLQPDCLFVSGRRLLVTPKSQIGFSESVLCVCRIRLEYDRLLEGCQRFRIFIDGCVGNSQVEVRVRIVRFEGKSFLESLRSFVVFAGAEVCCTEIVVNHGVVGGEFQSILVSSDCLSKLADVVVCVPLVLECLSLVSFGDLRNCCYSFSLSGTLRAAPIGGGILRNFYRPPTFGRRVLRNLNGSYEGLYLAFDYQHCSAANQIADARRTLKNNGSAAHDVLAAK